MISGDGDFCLRQWINVCCICLLAYNKNTCLKTNCQRVAFCALVEVQYKIYNNEAQYLSNVEIIIFSSLIIILCKKSCLCVLCMSVCS